MRQPVSCTSYCGSKGCVINHISVSNQLSINQHDVYDCPKEYEKTSGLFILVCYCWHENDVCSVLNFVLVHNKTYTSVYNCAHVLCATSYMKHHWSKPDRLRYVTTFL